MTPSDFPRALNLMRLNNRSDCRKSAGWDIEKAGISSEPLRMSLSAGAGRNGMSAYRLSMKFPHLVIDTLAAVKFSGVAKGCALVRTKLALFIGYYVVCIVCLISKYKNI